MQCSLICLGKTGMEAQASNSRTPGKWEAEAGESLDTHKPASLAYAMEKSKKEMLSQTGWKWG